MSTADDGTMTPSKKRDMLQEHLENLCKGMLAILERYFPSSGNETVLNNFINKCLCWLTYLSLSSKPTSFILIASAPNSAEMTNHGSLHTVCIQETFIGSWRKTKHTGPHVWLWVAKTNITPLSWWQPRTHSQPHAWSLLPSISEWRLAWEFLLNTYVLHYKNQGCFTTNSHWAPYLCMPGKTHPKCQGLPLLHAWGNARHVQIML